MQHTNQISGKAKKNASIGLAAAGLMLVGALASGAGGATSAFAQQPSAPAGPYTQYLPMIMRGIDTTVFGVHMQPIDDTNGLTHISNAQLTWTRTNGLLWSQVEPTEGARNWSAQASLEQQLIRAAQKNVKVVLIVRSAPTWARAVSNSECGPIRADKFAAFGNFMRDAVARYSAAPYNVKYWEIWNEQDAEVKVSGTGGEDEFGCWGNFGDPYFGGGVYGDMLKMVYPSIKSADSSAQVIFGGLLLDCDPNSPPAGKNCLPAKFLEGALRNGAGPFFDGVSFHAYDYYAYAMGKYSNSNWASSWNTTGSVMIAKARFIRQVLAAYNVTGKFLMNTESALLFYGSATTNDTFEATKAGYVAQANAAALAEGLSANIWFSANGWLFSGMFSPSGVPNYAFVAQAFQRQVIANSVYSRQLTEFSNMMGYEFDRRDARVWVMWNVGASASQTVNLPGAPTAIYDTFGNSLPLSTSFSVERMPVYVVWNR